MTSSKKSVYFIITEDKRYLNLDPLAFLKILYTRQYIQPRRDGSLCSRTLPSAGTPTRFHELHTDTGRDQDAVVGMVSHATSHINLTVDIIVVPRLDCC
jgi:hypothetical protein